MNTYLRITLVHCLCVHVERERNGQRVQVWNITSNSCLFKVKTYEVTPNSCCLTTINLWGRGLAHWMWNYLMGQRSHCKGATLNINVLNSAPLSAVDNAPLHATVDSRHAAARVWAGPRRVWRNESLRMERVWLRFVLPVHGWVGVVYSPGHTLQSSDFHIFFASSRMFLQCLVGNITNCTVQY